MNDNGIMFKIMFGLHQTRNQATFPNELNETPFLNMVNISDVERNLKILSRFGFVTINAHFDDSGVEAIDDCIISESGLNRIRGLVRNTFENPSGLQLSDEQLNRLNEIQGISDETEQFKQFHDFIFEVRPEFFDVNITHN